MKILDSDAVFRRVPREQFKGGEVTSQAFTPDEVSVHLARLTELFEVKRSHPDKLMVRLSVAEIRAGGFDDVLHDPTPEDCSHAIIKKTKTDGYSKKKRKRRLKSLAKLAKF